MGSLSLVYPVSLHHYIQQHQQYITDLKRREIAVPKVFEVRVPQSLLCAQSLIRIVSTELSDQVNTATGGMLHERRNTTSSTVREVELHVAGLAVDSG